MESCEHQFVTHAFTSVTLCNNCGKKLVGMLSDGIKCSKCGFSSHHHCQSEVDTSSTVQGQPSNDEKSCVYHNNSENEAPNLLANDTTDLFSKHGSNNFSPVRASMSDVRACMTPFDSGHSTPEIGSPLGNTEVDLSSGFKHKHHPRNTSYTLASYRKSRLSSVALSNAPSARQAVEQLTRSVRSDSLHLRTSSDPAYLFSQSTNQPMTLHIDADTSEDDTVKKESGEFPLTPQGTPLLKRSDDDAQSSCQHLFSYCTYFSPTDCDYCKKPLEGYSRQGLRCRKCGFNAHFSCLDSSKDYQLLEKRGSTDQSTNTAQLSQDVTTNTVTAFSHVNSFKSPGKKIPARRFSLSLLPLKTSETLSPVSRSSVYSEYIQKISPFLGFYVWVKDVLEWQKPLASLSLLLLYTMFVYMPYSLLFIVPVSLLCHVIKHKSADYGRKPRVHTIVQRNSVVLEDFWGSYISVYNYIDSLHLISPSPEQARHLIRYLVIIIVCLILVMILATGKQILMYGGIIILTFRSPLGQFLRHVLSRQ